MTDKLLYLHFILSFVDQYFLLAYYVLRGIISEGFLRLGVIRLTLFTQWLLFSQKGQLV